MIRRGRAVTVNERGEGRFYVDAWFSIVTLVGCVIRKPDAGMLAHHVAKMQSEHTIVG